MNNKAPDRQSKLLIDKLIDQKDGATIVVSVYIRFAQLCFYT